MTQNEKIAVKLQYAVNVIKGVRYTNENESLLHAISELDLAIQFLEQAKELFRKEIRS